MVVAFRFRCFLGLSLELLAERLVVEEGPWIVVLVVPGSFEIAHRLEKIFEFGISYER